MSSGVIYHKESLYRSPQWFFQQRQRKRALRLGLDGYPIRVEQIAHRENLYQCWQILKKEGGQAPGTDGYTYRQFCPEEVGAITKNLSAQVLDGYYRPERVRLVDIPKPGTDKFRTLKIGTVCDRVVGKALDIAFEPLWKKRFLPGSYAYRKRRSSWDMLADLEVAMVKTDRQVLAVDDILKAFDNVPVDAVVDCHRSALQQLRQKHFAKKDSEKTLALIEAVLRGNDSSKTHGIDQGGPYSPTALNVLLHYYHDTRIKEIFMSLPWFRYSDNLAYLCQDMSEGVQALEKVKALLQPLGLTLKGADGVKDLDRGEVAHLMGFSLRLSGKTLNYEIEPKSFSHLRQCLGRAHVAPDPSQAAHAVVLGWVEAYAPAFESGDLHHVLAIASDYGFRETHSLLTIKEAWRAAMKRWHRCRALARYRHRQWRT